MWEYKINDLENEWKKIKLWNITEQWETQNSDKEKIMFDKNNYAKTVNLICNWNWTINL